MLKKLVILESPAKAKTVGKILGNDYEVIATKGHIMDLPEHTMGVDIANDFQPKFIEKRGQIDVIHELKEKAQKASAVYIASDPDREGEGIAWHVANLLKIDPQAANRVTFNEITQKCVSESIKQPRGIDMELVGSYVARRVLDKIVGYSVSPVLTRKICGNLSAGRVQSSTLRLICDREREIQAFKPSEYWTIDVELSKFGEKNKFTAVFYGTSGKKVELKNESSCKKIVSDIENGTFCVSDVKSTEKKQSPFAPFTTSTLLQDSSHKLNFSATRTMKIAQSLYEGKDVGNGQITGLITYMRTDSVRISEEAQYAAKEHIKNTFGENYLPKSRRFYKNSEQAQDAHEAIRPAHIDITPAMAKAFLSSDEYKLYKLIYDRFIASQMADAVFDTTSVKIENGDYEFRANGKTMKFKGFMAQYDVAENVSANEEGNNANLPKLQIGDELVKNNIESKQRWTQPPARYNEASLIKTMKDLGIGRPSTYATTVSKISEKKYVEYEGKAIVATKLGMTVTDFLIDAFPDIVNLEFTANMEKDLDNVASGKIVWQQSLRDFYGPFEEELNKAKNAEKHMIESDKVCEKCGRTLVLKRCKTGEFWACPGYPDCKFTVPIDILVGKDCPKCGKPLVRRKSKNNKTSFIGCKGYPECNFMSLYEPTGKNCPKCGEYMVYKRGKHFKYIACSNKECGYVPSKEKGSDSKDENS